MFPAPTEVKQFAKIVGGSWQVDALVVMPGETKDRFNAGSTPAPHGSLASSSRATLAPG